MHLSTLTLNQLRYGELDPDETRSVRAHLDACENCRTRLQSQEAHRQAFVLEPVPEALRKPALPSRRPWTWLVPVLALAALLLVVPRLMSPIDAGPTPVEPETTNTKGAGILLEAWLETDDGPLLLADNTVLEAGDIIQLRYNAEE